MSVTINDFTNKKIHGHWFSSEFVGFVLGTGRCRTTTRILKNNMGRLIYKLLLSKSDSPEREYNLSYITHLIENSREELLAVHTT